MKEMRIPMDLQEFASSDACTSGVYPCYMNQFQIDTSAGGTASMDSIADIVRQRCGRVVAVRYGRHTHIHYAFSGSQRQGHS